MLGLFRVSVSILRVVWRLTGPMLLFDAQAYVVIVLDGDWFLAALLRLGPQPDVIFLVAM